MTTHTSDGPDGHPARLADATGDAVEASLALAQDYLALVRIEVVAKLRTAVWSAGSLAVGVLLALLAWCSANLAVALALSRVLPLDASFGVVAAGNAALAALLGVLARRGLHAEGGD
jgi:Putative Actinobacterial Holin-X, holin superfamily III